MRNRTIGLFIVLVAIGVGWWLTHRGGGSDTTATAPVTQPSGGGITQAAVNATPVEPAHLTIAIADAKGALAGAIRIGSDEDVIAKRAGRDGIVTVDLAPGEYAISASADGHEPAALTKKLAAGERAKIDLLLPIGGRTLSGTITDAYGGPIPGVRIDAAKLGSLVRPGQAIAMTLSGSDGKYKVTVAEGQLMIGASHTEYAPQSRYVEVGAAGATADFALVPGGVIEGIVRDIKTKEPVGGARVVAERDAPAMMLAEPSSHATVAGPDGKFRLAGLRPGAYELDAVLHERRTRAPTRVGLGVAEQLADVQILVGTGAVVRGKVVDDKGAPVAGVMVIALGEGTRDTEAETRPDGTFELAGLRPGTSMLRAQGHDYVPDRMTPVEVAEKDVDGVIVHVKHGQKLVGHVEPRQICDVRMDLDDNALASGTMPMMLAPITTKEDGNFDLSPVSPGKTMLAARCPSGDHGALAVEVGPAMTELVIDVKPGASIAGRVIDGEGKPVGGVTVVATPHGTTEHVQIINGTMTSGIQGLTTAAGTFELRGLTPATYTLGVLDRGRPLRPRGTPPSIKLAATDHKTGVEIAIDRATGTITGTVTGPDGKPLGDAWVSVHQDLGDLIAGMVAPNGTPDDGEARRTITVQATDEGAGGGNELPPALTDAKGHFELTGLPHQKFQVVAEAQAGKLRGRAANITPDATVDIKVEALTTLTGTVHGPSGPTALFAVELDGPTKVMRSFTQGAFDIGRVDPGNYLVRVTSSDGNGEARVTVIAGQPATVDIPLAANAVVVGTLVDGTGKAMPDMPVALLDDQKDGKVQISMTGPPPTSNADGKFRLEGKPGAKMLAVLGQPAFIKRGLTLEAGKTLDLGNVDITAKPPPK